jgi:signal transduction histidine kinase
MASLAGTHSSTDAIVALSRLGATEGAPATPGARLVRLHAFLADGAPQRVRPVLEAARARAARIATAGGQNAASDTTAAHVYAADVLAGLAAEGDLDPTDTQITAGALAEMCSIPLAAASFDLFLRTVSSPALSELPPVVAAEIQLRLLLHLDVAADVSLWRQADDGDIECLVSLGADPTDRHVRAEARAAITGRSGIRLVGRSNRRAATVYRFGTATAAVVARLHGDPGRDVRAYLDATATALSPLLERELLLERNAARERALLGVAENRLTRLGFDLHDGPIQDVLVIAAETRQFRDEMYPFVLESHRELAEGRFDDLIARLAELDRQLRETAHFLESRSIVSRPLAEILHREIEAFAERTGIEASVAVHGDPESLSAQQRVALYRAIQESLSNVREHSGAAAVDVRLQVRRSTVDVRVRDDGRGFEVSRSLALAAERGRLGLVGMGERMRMLGGTFEIDSRPGGPTTVRFSLPRWEPFSPVSGDER